MSLYFQRPRMHAAIDQQEHTSGWGILWLTKGSLFILTFHCCRASAGSRPYSWAIRSMVQWFNGSIVPWFHGHLWLQRCAVSGLLKQVLSCRACFSPRSNPFSSPEPVVSWSRGRETRGSGSSRYRMSEKFLTSGRACAEVTTITAHAHNGFLSLPAPLGEKFYFLSSLQRVASLGCFENTPLHSTWIHW